MFLVTDIQFVRNSSIPKDEVTATFLFHCVYRFKFKGYIEGLLQSTFNKNKTITMVSDFLLKTRYIIHNTCYCQSLFFLTNMWYFCCSGISLFVLKLIVPNTIKGLARELTSRVW